MVVRARVVLREGVLEHLMCKKGTKEHEAIVATDAAPKAIHAALLLTGAEVGHPVQFVPKFEPPAGTALAIEFLWRQDGQLKRSDAREWVWDEKTKAPLRIDWVFAGSLLYEDPVTKKPAYAADEGDLITVANFASAILDLPIVSSANDADRGFIGQYGEDPPDRNRGLRLPVPSTGQGGRETGQGCEAESRSRPGRLAGRRPGRDDLGLNFSPVGVHTKHHSDDIEHRSDGPPASPTPLRSRPGAWPGTH